MKEARIQNANLMVIAFSILQYPQTNIFAQHTQSRRHILSITFYCRCFNHAYCVFIFAKNSRCVLINRTSEHHKIQDFLNP